VIEIFFMASARAAARAALRRDYLTPDPVLASPAVADARALRRFRAAASRDSVRAVALAVVVAAAWCVVYGRTSAAAWRVPLDYHGDAWTTFALLKAAAAGRLSSFGWAEVPELGAPFGADWNTYVRQQLFWLAGGVLVRALGLFAATNLLVLLAAVLAALSFYATSRYFRARPEWALAGALAFALSPYLFYRSLTHITLAFFWPIPLAILVVTWSFGRRALPLRSRRFAAAAAVTAATALSNIYYAGLIAQFLVLASLAQTFRTQRFEPRRALAPVALLAVLLAVVLADNSSSIASVRRGEPQEAVARPYGNLERYALKPIELLLPLGNPGLAPWARLGASYSRGAIYRGEMGAAYLGLAGVGSLVWLAAASAMACLRRGVVPAAFLAVAWILADSVVGGLNGVLGTLGLVFFRATSRYSIWILALVLLWSVGRVSRNRFAGRRWAWLAALAAAGLVLADQLPPRRSAAEIAGAASAVASDATLVRSLEAALPAGAMLFQLPVLDFPEGARIGRVADYEHLRPYLHASRLRFSYGSEKGRPSVAWQHRAEALEPEALAAALERIGFSGLLVDRKGYEDGGSELRARLAASGRPEAWPSPDGDFLFVKLKPAAAPAPPDEVIPPATETTAGTP
jgi:hypothetical protein